LWYSLLEHAQKMGVNKNQNEGGGIMKAKSLLLTGLLVATGLTFLSLPAGAECWMTCPPGSTATPSSTGKQGATATTEPAVSPEERTPAKEPETAAKASTTSVPAKPKAVPTVTGATTEPAAVAPSTPPLPPQGNAAFQPAPAPSTVPAPVPIPGVVPGTDTMQLIPE
jgi:hypothetical protein